jgi:hypothetical protein
MSDNLANSTPQFGTAEYAGTDRCKLCNQLIADSYYRVNSAMACSSCADKARRVTPVDTHSAFMRALLFGAGAAVLGLILYSSVGIITGLNIGYVSLAVGYLVGKAMTTGSKGIGGKRYQISAAALTYAAVSMAAIPIALWQHNKESDAPKQAQVQTEAGAEKTTSPSGTQSGQDTPDQESPASPEPKMSAAAALGTLAMIGLASPFLELQDPIHGIIGLVILFVGIRFAWQATAGKHIEIDGPFENTTSKAAVSAG